MEKTQCILVMPAYNEEGCIEKVVHAWSQFLDQALSGSYQMIVVNDGSKDKTGAVLDGLSKKDSHVTVVHQKNGGHGVALLTGYREACKYSPEYIFHVDSDDQFLPQDFEKLWISREKSKFILGYRSERHDALHRLVITRILRMFLFVVFGRYIVDSNVPYRLIQGDYLAAMLATLPATVFAPNVFLSVLAARDGQRLLNIPVVHHERKTGQVSIVRWKLIKICFRCVGELIQFRAHLGRALKNIRASVNLPKTAAGDGILQERSVS